jgi:hypothetical protein
MIWFNIVYTCANESPTQTSNSWSFIQTGPPVRELTIRLRLEVDLVEVGADVLAVDLLHEVANVVAQAQEVLLELAFSDLAGHVELLRPGVRCDGAPSLDLQQVLVGDAVEEHDPTWYLEVVSSLAQVVRGDVGVRRTAGQPERERGGGDGGGNDLRRWWWQRSSSCLSWWVSR